MSARQPKGSRWAGVLAQPSVQRALAEKRAADAEHAKKSPAPPVVVVSPAPAMNKTEERYRLVLVGMGMKPRFGAMTLCLTNGAKRIRYTPDFVVERADGTLELHEVKGAHVWEDARVKFAVAVEQWGGAFTFVWAQWARGRWEIRRHPRRAA